VIRPRPRRRRRSCQRPRRRKRQRQRPTGLGLSLTERRVRQEKPGGGESDELKPSVGPSGIKAARQRLATSRNRVLRGGRATSPAKRTQGACRPCDRASKSATRRADAVCYAEGCTGAPPEIARRRGLAGVREQGMHALGSTRNLGGPAVPSERAGRATGKARARGCRGAPRPRERTSERSWYRQAKETKRGGRNGRTSELLVVPVRQGNRTEGTLRREGGAG